MKFLILSSFLIFANASGAFASDRSIRIENAKLDWNIETKRCEMTSPKPKKLDLSDCQKLEDLVVKNEKEYQALGSEKWTALKRKHRESSKAKFLDLELVSSKKTSRFGILKSGAQICDAYHQNCHPTSSAPADQLGFVALQILKP